MSQNHKMKDDSKRPQLVATDAIRRAMAEKQPHAPPPKSAPTTPLKSSTRVGQVFWCTFAHTNPLPEFDAEHLVVVIKAGKLSDVSLVVPLTKKDQSHHPHGYRLTNNPNPQSADVSWAVCDHIYAVSAGRLRPLRNARGEVRTPFAIDSADLAEISRRVRRVLGPFLQKGIEAEAHAGR